MTEIWMPVAGFDGLYEVSNYGRVKSLKRNTTRGGIMKSHVNKGYEYVHLCKNGKHKNAKVHRLVAIAFIPNPEAKPEVNHKDENKLNNHATNLEWATPKENINHGTRAARFAEKIRKPIVQCDMDGRPIREWPSSVSVERELGYKSSNIRSVCCGNAKSAYGFKWKQYSCMECYRKDVYI